MNQLSFVPIGKASLHFMWWSCFTYDSKGLYHIWRAVTKAQKETAEVHLTQMNGIREEICKEEWFLTNGLRRMGLRNLGGRRPKWVYNKKNGKLVRESKKGGIDWYRYWQVSLLIPLNVVILAD